MFKKSVTATAVMLIIMLTAITGTTSASTVLVNATPTAEPAIDLSVSDEYAEYQDFLSENYGIDFAEGKSVSQAQFEDAVILVYGEENIAAVPEDVDQQGFDVLEAVLSSVYYTNQDELAMTYSDKMIEKSLEYWINIPEELSLERQQELAVAVDSGLLGENWNGIDFKEDATPELATELFARILRNTGQYKNYAGYISDPDIASKILYIWNSFDQVSAPEFQSSSDEMVKEGIITGYNIKRSANRSLFDRERAVVYGHSSIAHAIQLINLMDREGLDGKVLLEPKTSAYLYLKDWGEPEESPEFQVEALPDGNYIAYAKEYDLAFEFDDESYKVDFDNLVKEYAKKSEDKQEGLIIDSWWQPLYSSETSVDGYIKVNNNLVVLDGYFIQSFSRVEDSDAIIEEFEERYDEGQSSVIDLWVNQAFYNYLMGESE